MKPLEATLARSKRNAHRHTLHDLDVVATGILGRQQAVASASRGGDALHFAGEVRGQSVDVQRNALLRLHALELSLTKVRGNPQLCHLRNAEQRLSGAHASPTLTD